jgi:hypothetical protein
MWVRIASHFPVWYETECLAAYRFHGRSNTARDSATAENIRDHRRALDIIAGELTRPLRPDWQRLVLRSLARASIDLAGTHFDERRLRPALLALREAFRCEASLATFVRAVHGVLRAAMRRIVRLVKSGPRGN